MASESSDIYSQGEHFSAEKPAVLRTPDAAALAAGGGGCGPDCSHMSAQQARWTTCRAAMMLFIGFFGLVVGLGVGLTRGTAGTAAVDNVVSYVTLTINTPAISSATLLSAVACSTSPCPAFVALRADLAAAAGVLPAAISLRAIRDVTSNTVLVSVARNAAPNTLSSRRMRRAQASPPITVNAVYFDIAVEGSSVAFATLTTAVASANTGSLLTTFKTFLPALAEATKVVGTGTTAPCVSTAATPCLRAGISTNPGDWSVAAGVIQILSPSATQPAFPSQSMTKTMVSTASSSSTASPSAAATATNPGNFLYTYKNILLSRVEIPAAGSNSANRVYIDEYNVNTNGVNATAARLQTSIMPFGEGAACSASSQCLTLPYNTDPTTFAIDEKLGQLTLSQDRCYVTLAGLNVPASSVVTSGNFFSFAAITQDSSRLNKLYWQANDNVPSTTIVGAGGKSTTFTSKLQVPAGSVAAQHASIPRAVALGQSASDDLTTSNGGSSPWAYTLYYVTGETGAPSLYSMLFSSNFNIATLSAATNSHLVLRQPALPSPLPCA